MPEHESKIARHNQIESPSLTFIQTEQKRVSPQVTISRGIEDPVPINRAIHIGPLWKTILEMNGYGGTERVVRAQVLKLAENPDVQEQVIIGNPTNGALEREAPNIRVYYPATDGFVDEDLYDVHQTTPAKAFALEKEAAEFAYAATEYLSDGNHNTIIHDHTERRKVGIDFAERNNRPVVFTVHGAVTPPDNKDPRDLEDLANTKTADSNLVTLVAISWDQLSRDPELFKAHVYNGINLAEYPFKPEKDPNNMDLVYLGRICEEKGFHTAVAIRQELEKRGINTRLLVGGSLEGTDRSKKFWADKVEPLLPDDNVVFLGETGKRKKAELLANARCVLVPIHWAEPFGLVPVEASACGTPVMAFGYGGLKETMVDGKTGAVIAMDEIDTMDIDPAQKETIRVSRGADAVTELLQGKRFDPYETWEHVALNFSDRVMAASYQLVYEDAIARARGEKRPNGILTFQKELLPSGLVEIRAVYVDPPTKLPVN